MKLFKSLLVAPATLGLLAPMAATANEVTVNDFNPAIEETLLAGGEGLVEEVTTSDVGFSSTTTMSGRADFQIGAANGDPTVISNESVTATYAYDLDLNTSFTGNDNLYVGIETGNGSASTYFFTDNSGDGSDKLSITSMFYTFPLGEFTVAVGPKLDSDDLMPTSTSLYSDEFYFGGSPYSLPTNFYSKSVTGSGVAISRVFDNGLNASASIIGSNANTSGLLTADGADAYTISLGYDTDNFGGGIIYQNSDNTCNLAAGFGVDVCTVYGLTGVDDGYNSLTFGAYYTGLDNTSISVTSSTNSISFSGYSVDNVTDFQIAVDRELGEGTLSASWKTFPFYKIPSATTPSIKSDSLGSVAEIYYTYNVNDSLSIKPGVAFTLPAHSLADAIASGNAAQFYLGDRTVVGVEATFKF